MDAWSPTFEHVMNDKYMCSVPFSENPAWPPCGGGVEWRWWSPACSKVANQESKSKLQPWMRLSSIVWISWLLWKMLVCLMQCNYVESKVNVIGKSVNLWHFRFLVSKDYSINAYSWTLTAHSPCLAVASPTQLPLQELLFRLTDHV